MKRRHTAMLTLTSLGMLVVDVLAARDAQAAASQWMDYFMPTPIVGSLSSTCWGAAQVGPRDQSNGLEDKTLANWVYWDGGIIKDDQTGTYHMFASRWKQSDGHNGWQGDSHCVHATSSSLFGPYTDQGQCFTDNSGLCHNVNALKLKSGDSSGKQYAITCSGGVPGSGRAYGANSLDGPWSYLGNIQLDLNGYSGQYSTADNFRTFLRPDGQYECLNSRLGLADNVLGPYKAQTANSFINSVPGSPTVNMEDPFIFYAGGLYHVIYHQWSSGKAYFYTSQDGVHNWTLDSGLGYDPATNMVRYTDGTVNHWPLLERSSVYIENGHAVAMTFAAINVQKADDAGNDQNGSKVIVVPLDGADYDSGRPPGSGGSGGMAGAGGTSGAGGSGGTGGRGAAGGGVAGQSGGAGAGGRGGAGGVAMGAGGMAGNGSTGTAGVGGRGGGGMGGNGVGGSSGGVSTGGSAAGGSGGSFGTAGAGGRGGAPGTAGMSGSGAGGSATGGISSGGSTAGGAPSPGENTPSGCSCATAGDGHPTSPLWMGIAGSVGMVLARRRRR